MELIEIAARVEAYDPRLSPDNRADELSMHQDIVMATGIGTLSPPFEATFLRSLDAAMTLVPEGVGIGWRMTNGAGGPTAEIWCIDIDGDASTLWEVGANPTATPALALAAAALRARAAQEKSHV